MQNFLTNLHLSLRNDYPEAEIKAFGLLLLEKITGMTRTEIRIKNDYEMTCDELEQGMNYIGQLMNFTPIQYILGETEFYDLKFKVNPSVLIPRPETEELVEWILKDLPHNPLKVKLLDIGTGSGCIAISLKKNLPNMNVSAMDISEEALKTAKENAELNQVEIQFIQADILKINKLDRKWDVIVSNPPYIPEADKAEMQSNVTEHEPHLALFVQDDDPLLFYRKIAEFANNHLTDNGRLYFEIHKDQGENCKNLLQSLGFESVTLRKDISGNDRMICAKL